MKKIFIILLILSITMPVIVQADSTRVRGYWRDSNHDGIKDTYVQPYQRTMPDHSLQNNYSYPGNFNPNTGQISPGNPFQYEQSHRQKNRW